MRKSISIFTIVVVLSCPVLAAATPEAGGANLLALKDSLSIAMEKSPAIITARENVTAADGRLGQAFGALLPSLTLSGQMGQSYTKPYTMFGIFTVGTEETASINSYTLTLSQPLYNGALIPGLQLAEAGYNIAKENYEKAKYDLAYNVVNAYYGALKASKMNDLSKDTLDMSKSHLQQVRAMLEAGTATKADVLRVEVMVANNEVGLMKADNALVLAKDAFNNILGRDLETPVALSEKELVAEIITPKTNKECLSIAFDNKADWKIFNLNKQINAKMKDAAYSGYFPSLALIGTTSDNRTEYTKNDFLNTDINTNTIVASAQWTLFDGLAREGRIKEANANLAALEASEESLRNGIVLEVKDACLNLESAVKMIKSAKKAVDLARENYRISKERYRTGTGSNLEMIDAETAFTEAQTNLYQAQFDYQIYKAKVNQAIGKEVYIF